MGRQGVDTGLCAVQVCRLEEIADSLPAFVAADGCATFEGSSRSPPRTVGRRTRPGTRRGVRRPAGMPPFRPAGFGLLFPGPRRVSNE